MSLFGSLFGDGTGTENQPSLADHERFPEDEYGIAYAIPIYEEDISAVYDLLEAEKKTPRDKSSIIRDSVEDADMPMEDMVEEHRTDIEEMIGVWRDQMESDPDTVWWPINAESSFRRFLLNCEKRAEADNDPFELPQTIGRVLSLFERCQTAQDNDAKRAVLQREYIPLEEDFEDQVRGL